MSDPIVESERDRRVAERAWQEGRESVAADFLKPMIDGWRPSTPNPYSKEI